MTSVSSGHLKSCSIIVFRIILVVACIRVCPSFQLVLLVSAIGGIARAGFNPIPLTSGSFNQDMVVEPAAPAPAQAGGYTTASMDNGAGNAATVGMRRVTTPPLRRPDCRPPAPRLRQSRGPSIHHGAELQGQ